MPNLEAVVVAVMELVGEGGRQPKQVVQEELLLEEDEAEEVSDG
jgi:hypothetical protein